MHVEDGDQEVSDLNKRIFIQERFGARSKTWFQWLFEKIITHPASRVGEIGCGPGTLWILNAARIPADWRVFLTDVSAEMVQEAQAGLVNPQQYFQVATADTSALPLQDGCLDLLLANGVLDVVADLQKTVGEAYRVLRPGGYLLATTGGISHLRELEELITPFEPDAKLGRTSPQFSPQNGKDILSQKFTFLERRSYHDVLTFNELSPILIYVRSEKNLMRRLSVERYLAFVHRVEDELNAKGEIHVQIEKVLFVVQKSDDG